MATNLVRHPSQRILSVKPESGGGLLLLRHVTPLARRHVVYFCSGAYINSVLVPRSLGHLDVEILLPWVENVYPHMPEAFPEQIVRARRASTVDHAQTDRRTLGPLQTDKYRYRIFIYEIGR
jgi:hypothetical protein